MKTSMLSALEMGIFWRRSIWSLAKRATPLPNSICMPTIGRSPSSPPSSPEGARVPIWATTGKPLSRPSQTGGRGRCCLNVFMVQPQIVTLLKTVLTSSHSH